MLRLALCIFCLAASGFAQDPIRMDKIVQSYAAKRQFMGSVLVARGDHVLFSRSYGFADMDRGIPNTPATRFEIGSITKQFTAAAILLLAQQGKLKIRDPIYVYLPDTPRAWDDIEVFHLLTHTSGIPEMLGFPEFSGIKSLPHTPEQLVTLLRDKPLEFPPGLKMKYSNSGYVLLGYLIEQVSGKSYEDFLQKHIFDPLGMKNSGCEFTSDAIPRLARGYLLGKSGPMKPEFVHMSNAYAAGGLYTTTGDLLRWQQGLFGGKLLADRWLARMTTPFMNGYALGISIERKDGRKQIGHGGATWGFTSRLTYFPESKITVAVLSNLRGEAFEEIAGILGGMAHEDLYVLPMELKAYTLWAGVLISVAAGFIFIKRRKNQPRQQERISTASESAIEIRNLCFSYSSLEVLHGISFHVGRGEMVGLLGPNGAGKSTTIKILAGIHPTAQGRVHIAGYVLPDEHLEAKKIIGYLPESPLMYECLSGMEFLELMGRLQGLDEKTLHDRIRALLEAFDLDNVRVPRMSGYSKGMRQKILLAAALLHDPEILLLDEPLSGLDVEACILVKDLLMRLCAQGKTILYSSHVLDVVEKVCHRVIVIDHGNILADAPLEELKSRTGEESLEVIFRKLTHSEDTAPKIDRVMEALHA